MLKKSYRLLWELANGLHGAQAKTVVEITRALLDCGQMRSFALAEVLARRSGVQFKSALQRFYRWVHNRKLDELALWSALADKVASGAGQRPVVAVDWTEWHSGLRVLGAGLCVGSRAVPVLMQAFAKSDMPRSQNTRENTFIELLVRLSPAMQDAVLIFDRGFRRASLIAELRWLRQRFIIRLAAKVHVRAEDYQGLLSQHALQPGELVDLGVCTLNARTPVTARVVGVWARGQQEPWWLASTLDAPARQIAELYDRRMAVEEAFRDSKGCRFGLKIEWTRFHTGAALGRVLLLVAIAMSVWVLAGQLASQADPTLRLRCRRKGARRSLIAVGMHAHHAIRRVLTLRWTSAHKYWPPPQIRCFS